MTSRSKDGLEVSISRSFNASIGEQVTSKVPFCCFKNSKAARDESGHESDTIIALLLTLRPRLSWRSEAPRVNRLKRASQVHSVTSPCSVFLHRGSDQRRRFAFNNHLEEKRKLFSGCNHSQAQPRVPCICRVPRFARLRRPDLRDFRVPSVVTWAVRWPAQCSSSELRYRIF